MIKGKVRARGKVRVRGKVMERIRQSEMKCWCM